MWTSSLSLHDTKSSLKYSKLKLFMNIISMFYCVPSEIFERHFIFEMFIRYFNLMILSCSLMTRGRLKLMNRVCIILHLLFLTECVVFLIFAISVLKKVIYELFPRASFHHTCQRLSLLLRSLAFIYTTGTFYKLQENICTNSVLRVSSS
jgi:hypothetical protein